MLLRGPPPISAISAWPISVLRELFQTIFTSIFRWSFWCVLVPIWIKNEPIWQLFSSFWLPKSIRKSTSFPNVEKVPHGCQIVSIWDPPTCILALKTNIKTTFSKNRLFRFERPLRHQKSPKRSPKGSQNGANIAPNVKKTRLESHSIFDHMFWDFWWILASILKAPGRSTNHLFLTFSPLGPPVVPRPPPESPTDPPNLHF